MSANGGWIGVDLDGTLAFYDKWEGEDHIGEPIVPMLNRVKGWIAEGIEVRIVTARAQYDSARDRIQEWCVQHGLPALEVTNKKDFQMWKLYDDRAIQVENNTGRIIEDYA